MTRLFAILATILLWSAPSAVAQSGGNVAVGMGVSSKAGIDRETDGHVNPGFLWRIGHGHDGWGWDYGLGWYAADLQQPVGAKSTDFGELHVRPFVGGYGYSKRFGRTQVSGKLLGGYAFNSFHMKPAFDDAYRQARGASSLTTDVSNTFVLRPEVSAWIDVSRKIGLNLSAGYTVARPEVTVSSSAGRDTRHIKADMLTLRIGAVYSIF
jgi:hypothetical protein